MSTAELFAALGDETRLAVLKRLGEGSASIVRLTEGRSLSRQALTKHLRVLERAGLVSQTRAGRETLWSLQRQRLDEAQRYLAAMSQAWDVRLARLKGLVENDA